MNNNIEPVLCGLFAHLEAAVVVGFTADTSANSDTLGNVGSVVGLFEGVGVFGPGVAAGATILAIDSAAQTVQLSSVVSEASTAGAFTTGFQTASRRLKFWDDVEAQPALFLRHIADHDEYVGNGPFSRLTVEAEIWIYSRAGENPDTAPDIGLNNLVRIVRESMKPDQPGRQFFTIGGKAFWCRIVGSTRYDPGDIDKQGKAVIPVMITLP